MKPPRSWIFDLSAIGLHDRLLPHASAVWVAVWEEALSLLSKLASQPVRRARHPRGYRLQHITLYTRTRTYARGTLLSYNSPRSPSHGRVRHGAAKVVQRVCLAYQLSRLTHYEGEARLRHTM